MASSTFFNLSSQLQRRIDNAYLKICRSLPDFQEPPLKKRKLAHSPVPEPAALGGGGFIVDDLPEEAADDEIDYSGLPNLPISHIPTGLQLLDLPPDDEQVLSIFRQAASGWEDDGPNSAGPSHSSQELRVSFEDWRAVCGVLLEHHAEEYAESTDGGGASVGNASRYMSDEGSEFEAEKEGDGGGGSDSADDLSDPDYMDESVPRQRRRRTTGRNKSAGSEDSDSDMDTGDGPQRRMTARQKQTCLDAFALFFPDATPEELPQKKIMISDVQRVAKLLKEKLKAEDIVEMLDVFSTSTDKSMNLGDFEQMMLAARLA